MYSGVVVAGSQWVVVVVVVAVRVVGFHSEAPPPTSAVSPRAAAIAQAHRHSVSAARPSDEGAPTDDNVDSGAAEE